MIATMFSLVSHVAAFLAGAIFIGIMWVTENPLERLITRGRRWRHVKRGITVVKLGNGLVQCSEQLVDMSPVVIYYHEDDEALWVRPVDEFMDGRFVPVA